MSHIPHQLSQNRPSPAWTTQEDHNLIQARAQGLNWQPIAERYFPGKTPNACRKRHERLMEKRSAEDWDGIKLEELAKAYFDVRREMWSVLADQIGEKWTIVEAKVLEKGFKNLSAVARSADRRVQGISARPGSIGTPFAEMAIDDVGSASRANTGSSQDQTGSSEAFRPDVVQGRRMVPKPIYTGPTIASMLASPMVTHA